jgi:hypothetical protein
MEQKACNLLPQDHFVALREQRMPFLLPRRKNLSKLEVFS